MKSENLQGCSCSNNIAHLAQGRRYSLGSEQKISPETQPQAPSLTVTCSKHLMIVPEIELSEIPFTQIELQADAATKLSSFGINLTNVRNSICTVLTEWKSSGVFFEYTDHSFGHVLDMLRAAEWVIPAETKGIMTPGDWLMLTLSTYFHDVGLLVTKDEFDARRNNPDFIAYCNNPIIAADKHREYVARLEQLDLGERDRIQYQEFVRSSHGKRIKSWVEGTLLDDADATSAMRLTIQDLLSPLEPTFRRDLAAVCESHTLGHVDAVSKLSVSKPYGGPEETVNLQYVAIILRTVDLLQITNRRAPTVLYQIINPSNPVSQVEWQKQGAVRTVRPSPARDRDGNVTKDGTSSAIEVHATFKEPNGFFGLTSYLAYAQKELSASYNLAQKIKRDVSEPYSFPWRDIDDRGIDTDGFLTESFEFKLDQHKILDLLTGHTLYNNSTVVLRELTQNALDAVRLQSSLDDSQLDLCAVEIHWDTNKRELKVLDRGTGMSQDVIENHLLTVGSSRYQDAKFKEKHPTFHSISRFGIGVLSAFMVSDDVEITTCTPDDDKARQIALQSVHGKYLIKLLDKVKDREQLPMYPHGTSVRLKLRPLAEIGDVLEVARAWLMFPRCKVTVQIDDEDPVEIGFKSPRQAVENYVDYLRSRRSKVEYKVEEIESDGVILAYALMKADLFPDWSFVTTTGSRRSGMPEEVQLPTSVCIEGVAVERNTPGFQGETILAVANATGPRAPKTNVARSALEDTAEQRRMLDTVYRLYGSHVSEEIARLAKSESYSLSKAVSLAPFVASPLISASALPSKADRLEAALARIPFILVEHEEQRRNVSVEDLKKHDKFITIESSLYRSIEYFVREAPADVTTRKLMNVLGNSGTHSSDDFMVCHMGSSFVENHVRAEFDIAEVEASIESRTITMTWHKRAGASRWLSSTNVQRELLKHDLQFYHQIAEATQTIRQQRMRGSDANGISVPTGNVVVTNLESYGSFIVNRERYLTPGTALANYFRTLSAEGGDEVAIRKLAANFLFVETIRTFGWSWDVMTTDLFDRAASNSHLSIFRSYLDREQLVSAIRDTSPATFDSYAWDRREEVMI